MMGLSVWGRGSLRLYCTFLGMVIGFAVAAAAGLITPQNQVQLGLAPTLAFPGTGHLRYAFNLTPLGPFLVAGLAAGVRCIGVLTTAQQINDDRWRKPDLQSIKGGVAADGLGCLIGGALGSMGMRFPQCGGYLQGHRRYQSLHRHSFGVLVNHFGLFPQDSWGVSGFPSRGGGRHPPLCWLPQPGGGHPGHVLWGPGHQQDLYHRRLLLLGLSHAVYPHFFHQLPHWADLLTSSMLSIATIAAIILNLIFRLGRKRTATISLAAAESPWQRLEPWVRHQGEQWGVGADILGQAAATVIEALEQLQTHHLNDGPVQVTLSYDDLDLVADIAYRGSLPQPPSQGQPLPPKSTGDLLFTQGLAGTWRCLCPDPVVCNSQGADCRIRLVF
jgi:xanthine permease XanP